MSVFKLWFAMALSFFLLPVVMMSFFPCKCCLLLALSCCKRFCCCLLTWYVTFLCDVFFTVYTIWVVYCFVYSIYDRTTNFWWPYILNLFLERAAKTRNGFKSKM